MRPTPPSLARILPRTSVPRNTIRPSAKPVLSPSKVPSLQSRLLQRRDAALSAGQPYPTNLRIEEPLTRKDWIGVPRDVRENLKGMIKEK